jgi:hypothetical protein
MRGPARREARAFAFAPERAEDVEEDVEEDPVEDEAMFAALLRRRNSRTCRERQNPQR